MDSTDRNPFCCVVEKIGRVVSDFGREDSKIHDLNPFHTTELIASAYLNPAFESRVF